MKNIIVLNKKEGRVMLKSILISSVFIVICSFSINARASGYLFESEINARATYDDNITYSSSNEKSASIMMVKPKATLTYRDADWDTTINANLSSTTYSSVLQDHIDSYFDLGTAFQSQRDTYSIVASHRNYSNRAVELDANNVGLTSEQVDHTAIMLAPKYTRSLTERLSLSLAYGFSDVSVDPDTSPTYLPYKTSTLTASMVYNLSQKSELSLVVDAIDYTSENNISEYQMLASRVGLVHNVSEMVTVNMLAGFNTRDFTTRSSQGFTFAGSLVTGTQEVENDSSGAVFEAILDAKWIELEASRTTDSNSLGGLDQTDILRAKLRMQITPLVGIALVMRRSDIQELNESVVGSDRVKTVISPAMNFTVTRNLKLRAAYTRVDQSYTDNSLIKEDSVTNQFYVNLKYAFPSI